MRSDADGVMAAAYAAARRSQWPAVASRPMPSLVQEAWWQSVRDIPYQLSHEKVWRVKRYRDIACQQLEDAISQIIARHDALRSSFEEVDGKLGLWVNPAHTFSIEIDRRPNPGEELGSAIQHAISEFIARPLYATARWLVRAKIISLTNRDNVVILVFNHIIADAGSAAIVLSELDRILAAGDSPAGLAAPLQYTDYAAWERDWYGDAARLPLIDYWTDWAIARPAIHRQGTELRWQAGSKVEYEFSLSHSAQARIRQMAKFHACSPFFLYLAFFAMAFSKWSGKSGFPLRCIGDLRRSYPDLAGIVGFLVCSDLIDIRIEPGMAFSRLLQDCKDAHRASVPLRLPHLLGFPPHKDRPNIEKLDCPWNMAATVNYFSDRSLTTIARVSSDADDETNIWPPALNRLPPEDWPIPLSPVYLRLREGDDSVAGRLQFNGDLVDEASQISLLNDFFDAIKAVCGAFRREQNSPDDEIGDWPPGWD